MKSQITKYILHLKNNPFDDANEIAKMYFDKNKKHIDTSIKYVVPELLQLMPATRSIVEIIVKDYTGIDIGPDEDSLNSFVILKKPGERFKELESDEKRSIKWFEVNNIE